MTGTALCAERSGVPVILEMTGDAVHGCALEDIVRVAGDATGSSVLAFQFEGELRVIHGAIPAVG